MAETYSWTGGSGPTASYAGDPNDYSGSGFNWNNFADSLTRIIPGILGGSAALYNAVNNQGQPIYNPNYNPNYNPYAPVPAQNNTALYIGLGMLVLLVVIALVYFLAKNK